MAAVSQSKMHGEAQNVEFLKSLFQNEQDTTQKLIQEAKHHEDNLKHLKSHMNFIDESIHHLQGDFKECHSTSMSVDRDNSATFVNTEEQTFDRIKELDSTAAGVICDMKNRHGSMVSTLRCTKDVLGIVASLGKVKDENLSRILSEYLGRETMLAIVCKTLDGVQALEKYDKHGTIDRDTGLHVIAPTIGRAMNGRFHVFCLQNLRPFIGEFLPDDPQKKLALMNPKLPNGKLPSGFLGFAVNMISMDEQHLSSMTIDGHGLRETLFFTLFSRLQVYKSRTDMIAAMPFITDGAVSLDDGTIKGSSLFCLGDRNDVGIRFPIADGKPDLSREETEIEQKIKFMELKKQMLSSDIRREETLLSNVKLMLKAESDLYKKLIDEVLLYNEL